MLVLESMQMAAGELVSDKAVPCWWHVLLLALLCTCLATVFTYRYNLLLIGVSVSLSGCVTCRWFAVVTDLICAV